MAINGYMRVSSAEQNEDRQRIALIGQGVPEENIFMDKQSGKDFDRPAYRRMLDSLREGDTLFVTSFDRLGRNYFDTTEQWRILTKDMKVDVVVIDMPLLDTRREKDLLGTFISDVVLQILSYVSENERNMIRQRQQEGIAAAKARGVHFGRELLAVPDCFEDTVRAWKAGNMTFREALAACNMKSSTFYRRLRDLRMEENGIVTVEKYTL